MNKDRKDIEKALSLRQDLIRYARNFPLSLARLWTPYCHRWDGLSENSKRKKGCGRKMTFVSESVWECKHCEIIETRTSQQEAIQQLGTEATLISGGNRAGKTQLGAQLCVAVAASQQEKWVQAWMKLNNVPSEIIPLKPSTVWIAALSYKDALEYQRPKVDQYLPAFSKKTRWTSRERHCSSSERRQDCEHVL